MNSLPTKPHFKLRPKWKADLEFYYRVTSVSGYPLNGFTMCKIGHIHILYNRRTDQYYYAFGRS